MSDFFGKGAKSSQRRMMNKMMGIMGMDPMDLMTDEEVDVIHFLYRVF